jgi:hypothetical protein
MIAGTKRFPVEQDTKYTQGHLYGALCWPGTRPGYIVVVGEHRFEHAGGHPCLDVLDEDQADRLPDLIDKASALDRYYGCNGFLCDTDNTTAMTIAVDRRRQQNLPPFLQETWVAHLNAPMSRILPELDYLLSCGRLRIPDTLGLEGELMAAPRHEDLTKLRLIDYPGLAALAMAVLELERVRQTDDEGPRPTSVDDDYDILA